MMTLEEELVHLSQPRGRRPLVPGVPAMRRWRVVRTNRSRAWHPTGQYRAGYEFTGFVDATNPQIVREHNAPTTWNGHSLSVLEEIR